MRLDVGMLAGFDQLERGCRVQLGEKASFSISVRSVFCRLAGRNGFNNEGPSGRTHLDNGTRVHRPLVPILP